MSEVRFSPGRVVATPGAVHAFQNSGEDACAYLLRHLRLDGGDLPPEDVLENELSVVHGWRILSAYQLSNGDKVWCITESDRSTTTFLLPCEY